MSGAARSCLLEQPQFAARLSSWAAAALLARDDVREAPVEIRADHADQLIDLVLEEMVRAVDRLMLDDDALLRLHLLDELMTSLAGATRSSEPCTIRPEDGQGARNEKS